MAIFTTAITVPNVNGFGLDTFAYDVASLGNYANATKSTTQARYFDDANNEQVFTGTGFTYDAVTGNFTGGTITGYLARENGVVAINIAAMSVTAAPIGTAINNGNTFQFLTLMSAGNDTITGSAFRDNLFFGDNAGTDTINGLAGGDYIYGGLGADTINGGLDNDFLAGGAGNDIIDGGTGGDDFDTLAYSEEHIYFGGVQGVTVNLSGVTQGALLTGRAIDAFGNTDTISNFEEVLGTGFSDTIYGAALVNQTFSFSGYSGNDTFVGSAGRDSIYYANDEWFAVEVFNNLNQVLTPHGITVNFSGDITAGNGSSGTINDSFGNTDTVSGIEEIRATFFVDTFNGGIDDEVFHGLKGADTINGGGGFDVAAYYTDRRDNNGIQAGGLAGIIVNFSGDVLANGVSVGTVVDGFGTIDQLTNIEAIDGTDFSDVMTGGADRVEFWAGQGDDTLTGGSADDELKGGDGTDTIHGGLGNDNLRGDEGGNIDQGNDQLFGDAGDDSFKGGAGNDLINGGADRDRVEYNLETTFTGDDATHGVIVNLSLAALTNVSVAGIALTTVAAGTAIDTRNYVDTLVSIEDVQGTGYDDIIVSGNSNSNLEGFEGNDKLTGGTGADDLDGGDGNDTLIGGSGDNSFRGGAGTDSYTGGTLTGDGQFDKISFAQETGGTGIVATFTGGGNVTITDTFGNAESGTGIDQIKGSQYADLFTGSTGDDSAEGMGGGDTFNMGLGRDFVEYDHEVEAGTTQGVIINLSTGAINATLNNGLETVQAGRARDSFGATDILNGVENVGGTDFNDVIYGSIEDNNLKGENGTDIIHGGAGNDNIRGDEGGNIDQGNDQLFGDAGDDAFKGGAGNDLIDGGADRDRVEYNLETTFTGDDATHGVIVNLSLAALTNVSVVGIANTTVAAGTAIDTRNYVDTLVAIEDVQGTGYADIIVSSSSNSNLEGLEGNDKLTGGTGADDLDGGAGNDELNGGRGSDTLLGGGDQDIIYVGNGLAGDVDLYDGGTERDLLDMSATTNGAIWIDYGYNVISGPDMANGVNLFTAAGDARVLNMDSMIGTSFNDVMRGDVGSNNIVGGAGDDQLLSYSPYDTVNPYASLGDVIEGREGNDLLFSGSGNDYLDGGSGNDIIEVGSGTDTVVGGSGNDTIFFSPRTGTDTVLDFEGGTGVGAGHGDVLKLYNFGTSFDTFAEVMAVTTQVGANTQIALTDTTIILQNFLRANLVADDFLIV
jgi:Ca2+-binding RTX toxin-like protein